MKQDTPKKPSINIAKLQQEAKKVFKAESRHAAFTGIMIVLLFYVYIVWSISQLAVAEPSTDQTSQAAASIPKIDKQAINQIQKLEENSPDVHSLFNDARNNPFQE